MIKNTTIRSDCIFSVLLGGLLTLSLAPFSIFPLAILVPSCVLWLWLKYEKPKTTFCLGYFFGLGFFATGLYWVFISIHDVGGVPSFFAFLISSGLIAGMALFFGVQGYLFNRYFKKRKSKILFAFPVLWFFNEYLRVWLFTGFPWLLVGYSQIMTPLAGYAPILGIYGVSMAVILTSVLFVYAIKAWMQKQSTLTIKTITLITAIWLGGLLLSFIPWTKPEGKPLDVSLIQGNIPQKLKWSADSLQLSIDRYYELSQPLFRKNNAIFWPEGAIPLGLTEAMDLINELDQKAKNTQSQLVLGIPIEAKKNDYYNSIVSVGARNEVYTKRHLVPFGEYMPFPVLFSGLFHYLNIPMSMMVPGDFDQKPLSVNGVKILPAICFEIAFPELMNTANPAIGALLTITNDAWFGRSIAQAQHLQIAQMRALEFKRPLLFVSNDGITAIINDKGKIDNQAPPHEIFVLNGTIQPKIGLTPWMKNGTDPILFIVGLFILLAFKQRHEPE